ncbi:AMP-binding protein, partial [Streptococcus agalactiae]
IISNQTIDKSFINRYKVFLKENNFILDEEVKYEDKLILSDSKIEKAINNVKRLADKVDLKNNYEDVVDRLIVNILTTKVIIFDNEGNYQKFANLAWKEILTRFKKRGGNEFSDFIKIFGINQDYKKYWGYSPKVIDTISNLFYLHSTEDDYLRLLKESVINYPQRVAVYSSDKNITYSELDKISDNFANEFLKSKGQHVIVNYPHTVELIPIIYGILKAGKVYVPVDNSG